MKNVVTFLFVIGSIFSITSVLFAGGIDNKHNYSTEYIRTLNRNAATDSADAVVYNPAGVVKMKDGLYVNLSAQEALKDYWHTISGIDYESDTPSFIPGLFGLYKQDKWAAFAAFTIPAGGGKVEYDQGSATTVAIGKGIIAGSGGFYSNIRNQCLKADSIYFGYTFGGAYAINDMVSVSLGARYIDSQKEAKGSVTVAGLAPDLTAQVDYEQTASGWGGIVGINLVPNKEFNIGIRYETSTNLDFETKVKRDDIGILTNGAKERRDLPALLGLGAAYNISPNVKVEANFTYYINEKANWNGDEDKVDNSYDLGMALEYIFSPRLKGSFGYMYTKAGINPDDMTPEAPELDAHSIGGGFCYEATPDLNLNFGIMRAFYCEDTTSTGMSLNKKVLIISAGIQYKFF